MGEEKKNKFQPGSESVMRPGVFGGVRKVPHPIGSHYKIDLSGVDKGTILLLLLFFRLLLLAVHRGALTRPPPQHGQPYSRGWSLYVS